MAKFDDQLSRMNYLMEFKSPSNTVKGNIEYHTNGADGKVYGILKEGTKYYIKTTENGKENISESYDYIGGFNNRKSNEFKNYNDATKHLELHLMSLNESRGIHEDVSPYDFNRGEKVLANLTEAARTELNRMKQIFENSTKIGMNNTDDPESKGKASADNTKKNNAPFSETANASLDKDLNASQSEAKSANADYEDASKGAEGKLTSDKAPKGNSGSQKDYKDAHDDLDGEGVADKKVNGHHVTYVNESMFEGGLPSEPDMYDEHMPEGETSDLGDASSIPAEPDMYDGGYEDEYPEDEEGMYDGYSEAPEEPEVGDDIVGGDDEEDLDTLLENLANECGFNINEEEAIEGDYDELTGPGSDSKKKSISMEKGPSNPINEEEYGSSFQGDEESLTGPGTNNKKKSISMEKGPTDPINEAINRITQRVMRKLNEGCFEGELDNDCCGLDGECCGDECGITDDFDGDEDYDMNYDDNPFGYEGEGDSFEIDESLVRSIGRMVNEEVTRLHAWGKHPRFRKEPMQLPPNKEVMRGTADRDFNDDSTKGEQPYGLRIGDGAPFNKKVEMLTDGVMSQLKESLGLKKK